MPFIAFASETYFVTICARGKQRLFQTERMALLMIDVLLHYRAQRKYLLHEFVVMPTHLHLLWSPSITVERCVHLVKRGFLLRAKKELAFHGSVWDGYADTRRVRDAREYNHFQQYIWQNPVRQRLCHEPAEFPWSSAGMFDLDGVPQRLKPQTGKPTSTRA